MNPYYLADICTAYAPYIINGDPSGLEDLEIEDVDSWMREYYDIAKEKNGEAIFTIREEHQDSHITRCDITGMLATCYRMTIFVRLPHNSRP